MNPSTVPPASAPDPDRVRFYEEDARRYAASLWQDDYMESTRQATQREITLCRLAGGKYAAAHANASGRLAIPELELAAALLAGWTRFWFRGELVPLPAELGAKLAAVERERDAERAARIVAESRATAAE